MNVLITGIDGRYLNNAIETLLPMIERACKQCSSTFLSYRSAHRVFCSQSCSTTHKNLHNNPMKNLETRRKAIESRGPMTGANNPRARWAKMTEGEAREWFEEYKNSGMSINKFAREIAHTNNTRITNMFKRYFPFEYESFAEQSFSIKSSPYQRGRRFEYRVRDHYKKLDYFVMRSPMSRGPADLVAIKKGEVLLIQCKTDGMLYGKEKRILMNLAKSIGAKAILAWRKGRSKLMIEVLPS